MRPRAVLMAVNRLASWCGFQLRPTGMVTRIQDTAGERNFNTRRHDLARLPRQSNPLSVGLLFCRLEGCCNQLSPRIYRYRHIPSPFTRTLTQPTATQVTMKVWEPSLGSKHFTME